MRRVIAILALVGAVFGLTACDYVTVPYVTSPDQRPHDNPGLGMPG